MIKGAIFDLDGTLLDSMGTWDTMGEHYVRSLGKEPASNLGEVMTPLSLYQSACYIKEEYDVGISAKQIESDISKMIENFYINEFQLKKGAYEFLLGLKRNGVKMCVATATDRYLVEAALKRCGILDWFGAIFTCSEVGYSKREPVIYRKALEYLGTERGNTLIFEDSYIAATTAKADGFKVVAICDASEKHQSEMKMLCDYYVTDFSDFRI